MPFLHEFFDRDNMIVAPLYGLGQIPKNVVTACAAPLKLVGSSGAPVRVLAW